MAEQVKRKLKLKTEAEGEAPATPTSASKKVRRVRTPAPKVDAAPIPIVEEEKVVPPVVEEPAHEAPQTVQEGFPCLKCGISLDPGTKECPICGERYLELSADSLSLLEKADNEGDSGVGELGDDGVLDFLEKGPGSFEVALICSACGTAVEFATDKCPICGADMENPDAGLVGLVAEEAFEEVEPGELICPQCGELVSLTKGKCPKCKSIVLKPDPHGILRRLDPVIHGDHIVFLHLDVESGELSYLQKAVSREGFEKMKVRLESA